MAPQTDRKMNRTTFKAKDGNWKKTKGNVQEFKKKRKWVPEHKVFEGSVAEGQGFAFKRKERVRHEYNKLLRKEKRRNPESTPLYKEEYPEHLRHLYLAEAKKLKQEAWTNRVNRSKLRLRGQESREETAEHGGGDDDDDDAAAAQQTEAADPDAEVPGGSDSVTGNPDPTAASEKESLPMSNRMRKKIQKKTSYQKTKEEFENMKEKRKQKKEEFLKNKQQKEDAIQKYKQKKMETFHMLSKKTKKGQPNLNLQMEYLLQKIQGTEK
ncbi:putative thyroid transcription factor 1-associated protein 26 [Scophthalmus maximus]|uniref:Putative thyroid transcription factor 1-associated protein 26 n=1 Tax=Scophthalmus maximus TaxID=52904 RepID=A0A2U9B2C9_SCOMX|nr:putative thyroid transcription factor 1-associated protein 26 [Scophthalmus maximus]